MTHNITLYERSESLTSKDTPKDTTLSPPYHHITRAHTPMRAPPSLIHASPMDSATISGPGGMVRAWLLAEPRTPPPAYPETQLGPGDAGMAWAADWQPDPKPHCLMSPHVPGARINEVEVASSLRPPYPPPRARPGRTFTGRAQSAGGGRSMPNSSSTKRLTPPARGPPSSGDPAILPSEPGSGQADWLANAQRRD